MGKASVILYISVGILVLFLVSYSPKKKTDHDHNYGGHNQHHRLKLRSSFNFKPTRHDPVPFDPLVAEMERRREDKEWERQYIEHSHPELVSHHQNVTTGSDGGGHDHAPGHESQPEWEDFMDAEDYLNDEEKFNVTDRLMLLFPKIDVSPSDGFVTVSELTEWTMQSSEKEVMHRTQRDMDVHDRNKDGFISFSEYEPPSWVRNANNNSFGYDMGWWKEEHFNASDADGDGLLNLTEFNDFLHPADTKNPKLLLWLCKEEVRERDSDKDGKISFEEFFHGLFDTVRNYEEDNNNSTHPFHDLPEGPAKQLFAQLDKDDDGYLSDTELLPVISKIHPTELYYAKQQADYIISQADSNKDGQLTLGEMIEHPYVFYSAIFDEEDTDDDYGYHDEFPGLVQYKFKKHPSKNRVQYQSLPRRSSGDLEVRRVFTIRKIRKDYTFFESCSVVIETCSIYVWFTLNTFEGYFFISKAYEGKQCYTCKGDKRQVLIHKTEIPDRKKLERVS